jgi:hypothetical protein
MVPSVLVAKHVWHLPLYRQSQMLAAQGLDIKRSVLAFWAGYAAAELEPVYLRLRELILASGKIAVDETVDRHRFQGATFHLEHAVCPPKCLNALFHWNEVPRARMHSPRQLTPNQNS